MSVLSLESTEEVTLLLDFCLQYFWYNIFATEAFKGYNRI